MAFVADELLINVRANITQAMAGLGAVEAKGSGIGGAVVGGAAVAGRALLGLGAVAVGTGALVAGIGIAGGIGRALDTEDARVQLERMGVGLEDIDGLIGTVDKTFDGTVFTNPDGFALTSRLIGAGQELDEIPNSLQSIADFAAHGNVPLDRMGEIFTRIIGNGKVTGRELMRLGDANIPISQIADALDMTTEELRDITSEGGFTSEMFLQAAGDAEMFQGAAKAAGDTTRGAFKNTMSQLAKLGELLVGPLFGKDGPLVTLFQATRQALIDARPAIEAAGQAIGDFLVPVIETLVDWLENGAGWFSALTGWLGDFTAGAEGFTLENIIAQFEPLRESIASMVEWWGEHWGEIQEVFATAQEVLTSIFSDIVDFVVPLTEDFVAFLQEIFGGWIEWFQENWPAIKETVEAIMEKILEIWNKIWPVISAVLLSTWETIKGVVRGATKIIQGIIEVFMSIIRGNWSDAWEGIKKILSGVWDVIKSLVEGAIRNVWIILIKAMAKVKKWWDDKWDELKEKFRDLFSGAADMIRGPFNTVIGLIESGINSVIDLINKAIDKVNVLPGVNFSRVGKVSIPRLAGGGVITRGGQALINDSTGPEQVGLARGAMVRPSSPGDSRSGPLINIERMETTDTGRLASDIGWELTKRGVA